MLSHEKVDVSLLWGKTFCTGRATPDGRFDTGTKSICNVLFWAMAN